MLHGTSRTSPVVAVVLSAGLAMATAEAAQSTLRATTGVRTATPYGLNAGFKAASTTPEPPAPSWSSPNWRPVSGFTGDHSVYYTSDSRHALNRLAFYEHSDDPNLIEIWLEELCHDRPCDPGPRTPKLQVGTRDANQRSKEIVAAGDDHYITAIQVCTTNENDVRKRKLKGVRIWTAKLEPGGAVNRTGYDPVEFDRPNCNDHWREKQMCIGNRVAVGLRAYYNDDSPQWNSRFYVTGLELQCAFVEG